MLVLGPDSAVSPLIFAAIMPLLAGGDTATAIALAGMLALLVGLIEIGLGLGKLGFVADLLSKEVQVGYMNGLGITIFVGQLPKLFGFSTDANGFIEEIKAFFAGLDQTDTTTLAVGIVCLIVLLGLPRLTRRVPAVLVVVVGATVVSAVLGLADHGVKTVGALPQGVPSPALPWTSLSDVGPLLIAAVGITLVTLTDTIATATSFAARRGDEVRAQPGDGSHGRREHGRRPLPGFRRVDQRVAHGRGRAVGRQELRSRAWSAPASWWCSCCSSPRCSPTCPKRRSPRWSSSPPSR